MGLIRRLRDAVAPPKQPLAGADADPETEIRVCLRDHVRPALEAVRDRLAGEGFEASLEEGEGEVLLSVINFNGLPLIYRARGHVYNEAVVNIASLGDSSSLEQYARIEIESGGRKREYPTPRCHREAMERHALDYFRRFLMRSPQGD